MKGTRIAAVAGALWLGCLTGPVAAQQPDPAPATSAGVVEELAGLGRSMDRLVILLERVLDNQRIDLLLRRLDLKHRRLAPMESELRGTSNQIRDGESQIEQLRIMVEDQLENLRRQIQGGVDKPDSGTRNEIEAIEAAIKHEEGRVADLRIRAQDLENELASSRREIAVLDDMLNELVE